MSIYDNDEAQGHFGHFFSKNPVVPIGAGGGMNIGNGVSDSGAAAKITFQLPDEVSNPMIDADPANFGNEFAPQTGQSSAAAVHQEWRTFADGSKHVTFLPGNVGPNGQPIEVLSNVLGPNETTDDVLKKTSYIWEQRMESAKLVESIRNVAIGDDSIYNEKYIAFRESRLRKCFPDIWSGQHHARLPQPVNAGHKWFTDIGQSPMVPTLYENLTYFANMMTQIANDFTIIANPGLNFEAMLLTRITCLAAPEFNVGQSLYLLLAGDASVGKSYILKKNEEMLPPGWVNMMAHLSTLALTSDSNEDCGVLMVEETPATMTQETAEKTGHDNGASFLKTLLTNKIVQTRTVSVEQGQRKKCVHVTSKMMTGVFATNGKLTLDSPLLKRYLVIKPCHDPTIAEKINKLGEMNTDPEMKNALLRQKVIAHLVQQAQLAIGMGCIKPPNMDAYTLLFADVVKSMHHFGHPMPDAKGMNNVACVVRTLVVMRAVCEACLSEKNVHLRFDLENNKPIPFKDNYLQHFANIEALLVAQEPEIIFGISMCHMIFGDDTEGKVIDAARNLCGIEFKDNKFILNNEPFFMPVDVVGHGDERHMEFKRHYIEMMPLEGRGLDRLLTSLSANSVERASRQNLSTALDQMMKKTLKHKQMDLVQDGETKNGHVKFIETSKEIISPIIVKKFLAENYEKSRINEDKTKESGAARFYILIPALTEYITQSDAMKKALLNVQHIGTIKATHLIASPLRASRTTNPESSKQPFYGIFETINFDQNKNKLICHEAHNALLPEQFNQLSSTMMFEFGNKDMPRSIEDRESFKEATKKRAVSALTAVRAVTSAVDYGAFMNRQQVCAASHDDIDVYYWPYFTKACLKMREEMPQVFGTTKPKQYPQSILFEAQKRNEMLDLSKSSAPVHIKLKRLARVNDLSGKNVYKKQPPSEFHMHQLALSNPDDLSSLRMAFSSNVKDFSKAPIPDSYSASVIKSTPDGDATWETVCTIFSEYKNAERTAKMFLKHCGFNLELLPPQADNPFRPIAKLSTRHESIESIQPKANQLLLKRKGENDDADDDIDDKQPQSKKPRAEDQSAFDQDDNADKSVAAAASAATTSSTSVNYTRLFEHSKKLTFNDTGSMSIDYPSDIDSLLKTYPESKEKNSNFNPSMLTDSSNSKVLPQVETDINPYDGKIRNVAYRRL